MRTTIERSNVPKAVALGLWLVVVAALSLAPSTALAASSRAVGVGGLASVQSRVLEGVSCTSWRACTAVGDYARGADGGPVSTLAEHWNGKNWTVVPSSEPSGSLDSQLYGVSCVSAKECTAVGYSGDGTLAEVWNGEKWTDQGTPSTKAPGSASLYAASCTSAKACIAVGSSWPGAWAQFGSHRALVESWNGKSWKIDHTPDPNHIWLNDVSCDSTSACTAVGGYYRAGWSSLAERWNGKTWTSETTPTPKGRFLSGVSCESATACTAVGGGPNGTLAEVWNGKNWAVQPTPEPGGAPNYFVDLDQVSCTSTTECTAVGGYSKSKDGADGITLAEVWNGSTWRVVPTPNPGGSSNYFLGLNDVSCTSVRACTAVGNYYTNNPALPAHSRATPVAEAWNGKKWRLVASPD
ncbi:MAG: hypothetical protein ACLPQS_08090 [Acidimicrobiales bacterium]